MEKYSQISKSEALLPIMQTLVLWKNDICILSWKSYSIIANFDQKRVRIIVTSIPKIKFVDPRMHVFYAEAETWRQNKTQGSERFTIQTNDRCAKARTAPTTILPPTWNKYAPNCHVHHAFCSWCDGVGLYIGTWGVWRYYSPGHNIRGMHPTCHIIVHQW